MDSHCQLLQLPTELIQQILSYLDVLDLISSARTCRLLLLHCYKDRIWQPIVNAQLAAPINTPTPCKSFRELYAAHHPCWFLTRHQIWFADTEPSGKLLIARFNPKRGSIEAHAITAHRRETRRTHEAWEHDNNVAIINFDPVVSLDLHQPVVNLEVDSPKTNHQPDGYPSDRGYAPPSVYSKERLMHTFNESGLFSSFVLCRDLPRIAIHDGTRLWPPMRFPAQGRTRHETSDGFHSIGHRPTRLSEVSQSNFRLRKWVEYTGRRTGPHVLPHEASSAVSAALRIAGPYFVAGSASTSRGGMSIRMPEAITTYATLPREAYAPTERKPWQGVWVGDYGGHGCEFVVILQPDKRDERQLPSGLDWLRDWFRGGRRDSASSSSTYASAREESDAWQEEEVTESPPPSSWSSQNDKSRQFRADVDYVDAPTGRLEAIKLTGDPHIPRAEYTFIAPDIGHEGFVRIADEEPFRGARVVRSAGHIAASGFHEDQYTPSQLIMISPDCLAQFWEGFGHISYFRRVDLDSLVLNYASGSLGWDGSQ